MKFRPLHFLPLLLLAQSTQAADKPPLYDLLPPDTLAFAEVDPTAPNPPNAINTNGAQLIDMGLHGLQSLGILKDAGIVGDILGFAGEAGSRRSCIAWLDADLVALPPPRTRPLTSSYVPPPPNSPPESQLQCNSVQLLWILEFSQPADMVERITRLVSHFSTRATAQQIVKKTSESKAEYVEFHDQRWPAWLVLAWAQQPAADRQPARFIFALGSGAMEHYLADRPVGDLPWHQPIAQIEAANLKSHISNEGNLLARVYVSPKTFRDRFPDAMQKTILHRLFATLDLATADTSLFTARIKDRAVSLSTGTLDKSAIAITPWTVPLPADAPLLKALPKDATAYLVLNVQWPVLYSRICSLCDAIFNDPTDTPTEKQIANLAKDQRIDIQKDILTHLQPLVLVHDSPQHPLHLPLMVTALAAVDPASEESVEAALAKISTALSADLDRRFGPLPAPEAPSKSVTGSPPVSTPPTAESDLTRLRIRTDPDGISYLQFGLVGPALGFAGNRILISWSPAAVRQNLPLAPHAPANAFQQNP